MKKKYLRTTLTITLLFSTLFHPTILLATPHPEFPNTHEFILNNGLKLIVREDHRAPVVTTMVWYKIGSVDEPRGLGGISHMLEHMMFKGTPTLKPNEHSRLISNYGGHDNAFTSRDYTAYFETLPSDQLKLAFTLEADRMQNLKLKQEDFTPEQQVVAEERRSRTDSDPQAQFFESFNATQWATSNYRNPVIGYADEIQAIKLSDLQAWYKTHYAPNNATVVVVGDVNAELVYETAQATFGKVPRRELTPASLNFEIPQKGIKRMDFQIPAKLPALMMSYKVPSYNTATDKKDADALLMLSAILDGGKTARLPKNLVRDQKIVSAIDASYSNSARFDSAFTFFAMPSSNIPLNTIEEAILKEINSLKNTLVSPEELTRINAQIHAQMIYQKDAPMSQAQAIGMAESTGEGWVNREKLLTRLGQITAQDIQRVAQKYLIPDNLTIGTLTPLPMNTNSENAVNITPNESPIR